MTSRQDRVDAATAMWRSTTWEEVATFLGPNAEKYRSAFEKTREKAITKGYGTALGWSWPALIFGFAFFFYRKQWAIGAALLIVPIVLGYFLEIGSGLTGVAIVMAMYAKSFVVQQAVTQISKIKAAGGSEIELAAAGGVSLAGGVAGGVLWLVALLGVILAIRDTASA